MTTVPTKPVLNAAQSIIESLQEDPDTWQHCHYGIRMAGITLYISHHLLLLPFIRTDPYAPFSLMDKIRLRSAYKEWSKRYVCKKVR